MTAVSRVPAHLCEAFPPARACLADALAQGGDQRITLDPVTARNSYGCIAEPDPDLVRLGSSTASTIGSAGFAAAEELLERLGLDTRGGFRRGIAAAAAARIRRGILDLAGVERNSGVEAILAASGTDAHLIFTQMTLHRPGAPWLVLMPEPAESGSGVPGALAGRHFADHAAMGNDVTKGALVSPCAPIETRRYALREPDGSARNLAEIDAEITAAIVEAVAAGRRVLLVAIDVSKTGIVAPSPGCVLAVRAAHGDAVEVLVDACQFRLSPERLNRYLNSGCALAITGSKFMGGPIFSGALLLPSTVGTRLRALPMPPALAGYSAQCDWDEAWRAAETLSAPANTGLLLRWEAALAEMRPYGKIDEQATRAIAMSFGQAVLAAMESNPAIEPVLDHVDPRALGDGFGEDLRTIFPFYLVRRTGTGQRRATMEQARQVYRQMPVPAGTSRHLRRRFELGQPVAMAHGEGALRLSLSAPLIAEAHRRGEKWLRELATDAFAKAAEISSML
ncbi:hypothetical protein EDF56_107106 [Novosphingobium sp. PhB165]|uniref:hypothetical protein n=1 Tax=Novosphingobium sp. PhB165 TaxID=2485105 RepID=UPI00104A25A0|nr:hypothetical protein [Novosphingobium sp. PhB165]TCM16527.1 hypothetical protein EDF56_107106 [Novosphingobium sp. PhB165]